ncbi:hypothetical protein Gotur_001545 [Gossypium turneri]
MEKGFLDKVEDNAAVRIWSEKTQQEKGGSLLKEVWYQWDDETKQLFYFSYGDLPYLLNVKKSTQLCSFSRGNKPTKLILEPPTS